MDTHIAAVPDLIDPEDALSARLPGEPVAPGAAADPDLLHAAAPGLRPEPIARASNAPPGKRRRTRWFAGVAIAALLAGGTVFVLSSYNHVVPVPTQVTTTVHRLVAQAGTDLERPFAPAASLASVNLPPAPSPVVAPRYQPKPRDASLREILALRPGGAEQTGPSAATSPPSAAPGSAAVPPPEATGAASSPAAAPPRSATSRQLDQTGVVPHEPGSPLGQPGVTAAAGPAPATIAPALPSPPSGHASSTDVTQAVVAAATGRAPATGSATATGGAPAILEPGTAAATTASAPPAPSPASSAPPSSAATASASPVAAPASAASSPDPDAAGVASPRPAGAESAAPARVAAAAVGDSAETLRHLHPAPMTSSDQLQVLQMVTQMATMVKEMKQQSAALRADFAKAQEDQRTRLRDFERRVDLAEARAALAAAADPAAPPPAPASQVVMRPIAITRAAVALSGVLSANLPADAKRYRVQAASPGLALLAEVDRGGGDGAQLQVTVGDTLPGWGKVKSVAQRGASWVVATEHGVIE